MKVPLRLLLLAGLLPVLCWPAAAQITDMSNRKLHLETRRAQRQAHRAAKKEGATEYRDTYLNMNAYTMKEGEEGRKKVKTSDGRDNYQFNKKGEPMVTDPPVLTRRRLRKK